MKLTAEEIMKALKYSNIENIDLGFEVKSEVIARLKKAGIVEEGKYVVLLSDSGEYYEEGYRYAFLSNESKAVDRCDTWKYLLDHGTMTMEEIKEINPHFEPFAIKVN